ncbi:MAG: hypothetical protein M1821_005445 [Bathelium mastoideum]|nr:MAG: hypothetical protein M1821_005445 [Bathelium mastoideum]KAI9691775.1 MAG: hypothetical protein M1822_007847 [Bathelium mastoideum]
MPRSDQDATTIAQPLTKLSLQTPPKSAQSSGKKAPAAVADSWEDEDDADSGESSDTETEANPSDSSNPISRLSTTSSNSYPSAPPPTPSSPSFSMAPQNQLSAFPYSSLSSAATNTGSKDGGMSTRGDRRPETSTAAASRMIAAGLGVRAPKRTEEQREYDRVVREKEKKRLETERAEVASRRQAAERAKAAVWES